MKERIVVKVKRKEKGKKRRAIIKDILWKGMSEFFIREAVASSFSSKTLALTEGLPGLSKAIKMTEAVTFLYGAPPEMPVGRTEGLEKQPWT